MASSPITSWQIDGEKVEAVTDFISLASKITLDGYRSHEIKGLLILEIKAVIWNPAITKYKGSTETEQDPVEPSRVQIFLSPSPFFVCRK